MCNILKRSVVHEVRYNIAELILLLWFFFNIPNGFFTMHFLLCICKWDILKTQYIHACANLRFNSNFQLHTTKYTYHWILCGKKKKKNQIYLNFEEKNHLLEFCQFLFNNSHFIASPLTYRKYSLIIYNVFLIILG